MVMFRKPQISILYVFYVCYIRRLVSGDLYMDVNFITDDN